MIFWLTGCLVGDDDENRPHSDPDSAGQADLSVDLPSELAPDQVEDPVVGPLCDGACEASLYTECTCAPDDPCGWQGDGICDVPYCSEITSTYYQDSADCQTGPVCDGQCGLGQYTECTCGPDDPCGWSSDGYCDETSCAVVRPSGYFADPADCEVQEGTCNGECDTGQYTECTCGADDPCGWAGNGTCDQQACNGVSTGTHFDDSADCSTTTQDTYVVTAVRDDLDNTDMDLMATGLRNLGMTQTAQNTNVSTSALTGYLSQELTVLYHTGHGESGEVLTSNGSIHYNQVTINVHHTVFATCLTLARSWAQAFGDTAQTILGYTDVSYDYTDDEVAEDFLDELGRGKGYMEAWYLANDSQWWLSDRWAGYVREGSSIVEYSARRNNYPTASTKQLDPTLRQVGRSGRLWIAESLLSDRRRFEPAQQVVADPQAIPAGQLMPGGWSLLTAGPITPDQAVNLAETFADSQFGGPDPDAMLADVIPVISRTESGEETTVGYMVRYARMLDGLPIRGNRTADHLILLVGPQGVVAWSRYWPALDVAPALTADAGTILSVGEAISLAADRISMSVKGEIQLLDARPVYGTRGPNASSFDLVPAYELIDHAGGAVVIDARTGLPL